jgi:Ni,Fe-hydrogenase I large subunit
MSPEENLLVTAHYLEALKKQATAAKMMAILGGKNPHPQSTVVGGVTCGGELSADRLNSFRAYLEETRKFVDTVYIPDLKAVAAKYPEWTIRRQLLQFHGLRRISLRPQCACRPVHASGLDLQWRHLQC